MCLLSIRHVTAHAIFSFEAPTNSSIDFFDCANHPRDLYRSQLNSSQPFVDYCRHVLIKETLIELLDNVLLLIADLNAWFNDHQSPLDPLDIQNFSCVLECRLLKWLHDNEHSVTPLEDALCVALLIFTVRTTEALKRSSDIHLLHFAASQRLEKALNCTTRSEWQRCPDILLWILSIGAISANGSTEETWFVYQASLACIEFDITSSQILLDRLHRCGWVSFKLDHSVEALWDRINELRLEKRDLLPIKSFAYT